MRDPYLRILRTIFILLGCYLTYVYLQQFFEYFLPGDYILILPFAFVLPVLLVYIESRIKVLFTQQLIMGLFGLVCGLSISALILMPLSDVIPDDIRAPLQIGLHLLMGYFGGVVGLRSAHRLDFTASKFVTPDERRLLGARFVDTSVLIDGRIADMARTGFLDGLYVVPKFVTEELQALSDSTNHQKRSKGRRGLEILENLRSNPRIELEILSVDSPGEDTVDRKLLALAKQHVGVVYTVDFNLSKVAEIEQVKTVNINQLSLSLKRAILPGERLDVALVREGKEENQGIGYLEDGTMVVVEKGRGLIGQTIEAEVSSIIQTASGQMVFARPSVLIEYKAVDSGKPGTTRRQSREIEASS